MKELPTLPLHSLFSALTRSLNQRYSSLVAAAKNMNRERGEMNDLRSDNLRGSDAWLRAEFTPGLVSVIIPTHNREKLILETLENLRAQTWKALEIVVVDDGSTDGTLGVLEEVAEFDEGRKLRVLHQANAGVSAARNTGTRASTGEFIVYLDSDDVFVSDAIEHFVTELRSSGCDYCHSSVGSLDAEGHPETDDGRWHSHPEKVGDLFTNMWTIHAGCYRRSTVVAAGPWNEAMDCAEDQEFILRIKSVGRGVHLDRIQGYYRMHGVDQLHLKHNLRHNFTAVHTLLDSYVDWLNARGPIPKETQPLLVERYRFVLFRHGCDGDMRMKNLALHKMRQHLQSGWSSKRFYLLLRWINFSGFYLGLASLKHRFRRGA